MIFKDPLDTGETPYETLGFEPDASPAEIEASFARFLNDRNNLPRLAAAEEALRKLKTPAERARVDLGLYRVDAAFEQDPAPVPCYPVEELYSDLTGLDLSKEIASSRIHELRRYDEWGLIDLTPDFDR
jgi:hypothetical protein